MYYRLCPAIGICMGRNHKTAGDSEFRSYQSGPTTFFYAENECLVGTNHPRGGGVSLPAVQASETLLSPARHVFKRPTSIVFWWQIATNPQDDWYHLGGLHRCKGDDVGGDDRPSACAHHRTCGAA